MIALLLSTTALLAGAIQAPFDTDTTVSVQRGTRLRVQNQGGDIVIKTWDRNQLRVQASHSRRSEIVIEVHGAVAEVEAKGRRGGLSNLVDYQITAPSWMALELGGMYAAIDIDGTRGAVKAQTLEGDIVLRGGGETVSLNTVNGRIVVSGARGRLDLHSVSEGIQVSDAQGDITAETVSGDIDLRDIDARSVDVQTVSGDLIYSGRIADGGTYSFLSHSGEIEIGIPEGTNATISAATASGDVSSTFGLTAERRNRRRQTFRVGSGSATVDLETFSGDVHLVRPSELSRRRSDRDDPDPKPRPRPNRSNFHNDGYEHEEEQ